MKNDSFCITTFADLIFNQMKYDFGMSLCCLQNVCGRSVRAGTSIPTVFDIVFNSFERRVNRLKTLHEIIVRRWQTYTHTAQYNWNNNTHRQNQNNNKNKTNDDYNRSR